ncbi:MAG: triple tyrosine motif-containing protein, partial [Bacteroidales bacterium]|nr:triple tyrosine motif-containing protein [Bacteroidales bacterium]
MIKQVLLFAIIYFSSYSLFSQQSYNLLNYSKVDGLSDNYIYDLEEDFRGQIWIASGHGINSFNGSNFKTYLRDDTTYSNLVRNDFLCVYEDGNNQLWFGSYNGTIYRFNHELHKFEDVSLHHVTLLEYPIFRAFYQSDSSELYGLSAHGVYRYSIYSHKFHKGFREFPVLNNEQVYAMHIDTQGNYWIGTNTKGLLCFSADSSRKIIVEFPAFSLQKPPVVRKILSLSDSLMLLGTSHGLFSVSYSDFGKFSVTQLYKDDLDGVSIDALAQDKEGNVWIGTTYKGLWIMTHKNHLRRISDIETDGVSIAIVNDIICDRDGRVWIASHGNGLFMYNPDFSGINQTGTKSGLSHNVVSAIQSDSHGNLWVGTDGGGITIFDDDMNLRKVLNQESGLSSNSIMSFELDDEYMWVSAWSGGIMRIHTKNYEIERFVTYNSNLSTNAVKSICLVDNEIYLGTHEHGLGLYNKETDSITMNLPIDYGEYYPNVQKYINKIIYDSYGKIWVATIRNLYCIENGKAINVIEKDSHIYSHNPIEVCDIVETHDNKILVATNKGPFVVDAQTFEKRSFDTLIPELAQTNILSVLSTQDSTYWLASVRGLFQYNPYTQSYKKVIFSKTSLGLFFFERAAFVDSTGTIYFGTNEGLFTFKPSEISQKHAISELYFSDLYISYEKQIPGSSTLPKHLSYVDTLVLDAYNTTWGVAFESVCYNSPEAIEYAYRLIGFDDNWNYLGKKHEVVFTNLPPGTYELQVKAWQLNIDDALSTSLFIEILPPWWKTWWFTVFALLGLALLLYVLYYMRLVSLEKQKRKLKKEVAQQTKKLENQKQHIENQHKELLHVSNKLQESNEVLSIQKEELEDLTKQLQEESSELAELNKSLKQLNETNNQFFSLITHDVKNSFYSIHSLSETLKNDYDAITTAQKHKITSLISNATLKTVDLLENLLYWSKMQSTTIECCPEYCTINEIVHYVLESYQHLAQEKNITIHFDATYDYKFYADREMIVITIRNIYNNALKYTPEGGSIEILVREIEDDIEIQIKDTGIG